MVELLGQFIQIAELRATEVEERGRRDVRVVEEPGIVLASLPKFWGGR